MDFFQILVVASPVPYAHKKEFFFFKTLLLPQITFESFQTFSEFSSQWSSQMYCIGFLEFWVFDFSRVFFFFVFVNIGPCRSQNFKTPLLLQITFESFQAFSDFSSQWPSQKYSFDFLKFRVFDFSGIIFASVNMGGWVNQAYSRFSTTHGHITDCKLDSVAYAGVCVVI